TDYSQAISFYSKYIQKNPNDKDGFFYRGLAYEKIGDDIKAFQDFLQAIDFDPEYFDAYLHIDYLLAKESRYLEIITHWSAYIQRADTNGRAYLERGGAYFRSGKIDPALKDAKRACDLGEEHGCQLVLKYSNQ
ncbi:MAG: tetratricopeptide (TPR) repeat protein, partial [Gammaproteobacteria bacterium]